MIYKRLQEISEAINITSPVEWLKHFHLKWKRNLINTLKETKI